MLGAAIGQRKALGGHGIYRLTQYQVTPAK